MSLATLLTRRAREQGAQPLVTQVSDAGRTELSATTLMNAAAKIGNLLLDEFDLAPGESIGMAIPPHWQRSCWLAGAWLAGIAVATADDPASLSGTGLRLIVAGPLEAAALSGAGAEIAVVSLHPLGMPEPVAEGCLDATSLARIQPDAFLHAPADDDAVALVGADGSLDHAAVIDMARTLGTKWGLRDGGRLLLDPGVHGRAGWLSMLAVPLAMRTSVVLGTAEFAEQERITAVAT